VASALIATLYLGGYGLLPFPLPLLGADQPWVALDAAWISTHLGLVLAIVAALGGAACFAAAFLVNRRRAAYAALAACDRAVRVREYTLFIRSLLLKGLLLVAAGVAAYLYVEPAPLPGVLVEAKPVFPLWVGICAAAVQLGVVLVKTLAVAWLFIWVRWTLPRFRYDQIMVLGWKVMLNLALLNLVVTAVIARLVRGVP
jgi:NADH-quinone oxidoreductase subunit H